MRRIAGIGAFYALLTFVMVLSMPAMVMACPGCKEALFEPGQLHQRLATAQGYALSIALLLVVPAGLVGGIALRIVHTRRRGAR